jgi:hypothetical protein
VLPVRDAGTLAAPLLAKALEIEAGQDLLA